MTATNVVLVLVLVVTVTVVTVVVVLSCVASVGPWLVARLAGFLLPEMMMQLLLLVGTNPTAHQSQTSDAINSFAAVVVGAADYGKKSS